MAMSPPSHVALIGAGFTGTSAFFQLVDRFPVKRITIFEASGEPGPGFPYRLDECRDYLVNNSSDMMCLVPGNRRAFFAWLQHRPDLAPDADPGGHVPRAFYGAFLKDVFASTVVVAAVKGIAVDVVPHEALAMSEEPDGRVRVGWTGGEIVADAAILTIGRCPPAADYPRPGAGAKAVYLGSHIRSSTLDGLPPDATVHVLGASLSAYDVVNRLFSSDTGCRFVRDAGGRLTFEPGPNRRQIVLCSRSGRLKSLRSSHPVRIARQHLTRQRLREIRASRPLRLEDVMALVRREADAHGASVDWERLADPYGGCRTAAEVNARAGELLEAAVASASDPAGRNFLVDLHANAQIDLWDAFAERLLPTAEEQRYRERFETAMLAFAAPSSLPTGERLAALHRAGRLRVVKGVRGVSLAEDGSVYHIAHEHGWEAAQVLVNATRALDRNVGGPHQPALIRSLVGQGLLSPYTRDGVAMNGAAVDMTTFRLAGSRSIHLASMLLWGPGFFPSSAYMMARVVEKILESMFPRAA